MGFIIIATAKMCYNLRNKKAMYYTPSAPQRFREVTKKGLSNNAQALLKFIAKTAKVRKGVSLALLGSSFAFFAVFAVEIAFRNKN